MNGEFLRTFNGGQSAWLDRRQTTADTTVIRSALPAQLLRTMLAAILVFSFPLRTPLSAEQISPTPVVLLNSDGGTDTFLDAFPRVRSDGTGNWVAVWEATKDFKSFLGYVSRSTDNGTSWSDASLLWENAGLNGNSIPNDWLGLDIATDGDGNWVAVWRSKTPLPGEDNGDYDKDIFVSISADNGLTWSFPALLNLGPAAHPSQHWQPRIATDGVGTWIVTWYSDINMVTPGGGITGFDNDIFFSRSTDNGASWSALFPLVPNLIPNSFGDSGDDIDPQIATDGKGNWVITWRSRTDLFDLECGNGCGNRGVTICGPCPTDYDIMVAHSTDNGVNWSAPSYLNSNAVSDTINENGDSVLNPIEDERARIATNGNGVWITTWKAESGYFSVSTDNGSTWTDRARIVADENINFTPFHVATGGFGVWTVVGTSTTNLFGTSGIDGDVVALTSTDNGLTWGDLTILNSNADTDSSDEDRPWVATDRFGHWLSAWASEETPAGTINDFDIYLTTFFTPPAASQIYVDFTTSISGTGTQSDPFKTLLEASKAVNFDGTIRIIQGNSPETFSGANALSKAMRLESVGPIVRIGAASP